MPNCVEDCVEYVNNNPDTIYLFGKIKAFGATEQLNTHFENNVFDYSFFDLKIDEQLERLIFESNCVPAATCFYNRRKSIELGITNDERIPLLEDWPKWINALEKGINLNFIDKNRTRRSAIIIIMQQRKTVPKMDSNMITPFSISLEYIFISLYI
jgi:hypothetical protein